MRFSYSCYKKKHLPKQHGWERRGWNKVKVSACKSQKQPNTCMKHNRIYVKLTFYNTNFIMVFGLLCKQGFCRASHSGLLNVQVLYWYNYGSWGGGGIFFNQNSYLSKIPSVAAVTPVQKVPYTGTTYFPSCTGISWCKYHYSSIHTRRVLYTRIVFWPYTRIVTPVQYMRIDKPSNQCRQRHLLLPQAAVDRSSGALFTAAVFLALPLEKKLKNGESDPTRQPIIICSKS